MAVNMDLQGKGIIVTGGANGIGRSCALLLAKAGARVIVADVEEDGAAATAETIQSAGGEAFAIALDAADEGSVEAMMTFSEQRLGEVYGAVNAAGVAGTPTLVHELETAAWNHILGVNLNGIFLCVRAQIRTLLKQGKGGSIAVIASIGGNLAIPRMTAYCTSKAGVLGFARGCGLDYADQGIRVNSISPGAVATRMGSDGPEILEMLPMHRQISPDEIADGALWLMSDLSSSVTASDLVIDGAFSRKLM